MNEFFSRLTWVDYIVFIALVRGIYVGYKAGLFPELLRVASYVVTAIVTIQFNEVVSQYLTLSTFMNSVTANALSFLVLIAGTFFLAKLLSVLLLKLLKVGSGGVLNRILGLGVGACRWIFLLSLLFLVVDRSPFSQLKADIHTRSLTGPKVCQVAPLCFGFLSNISPQFGVPKK